jgi:hypothetical protein
MREHLQTPGRVYRLGNAFSLGHPRWLSPFGIGGYEVRVLSSVLLSPTPVETPTPFSLIHILRPPPQHY